MSKNGQTWVNRETLVKALRVYANQVGFLITLRSTGTIQCNRRNYCNFYSKRTSSRNFKSGKLQCDCNFHIKVKAGKSIEDAKKRKRPAWNDPYCSATIVSLNLQHSGGCIPSPQQHVMTKARARKYVGDISNMALFTLCNTASRAGRELDSVVSGNSKDLLFNDWRKTFRHVRRYICLLESIFMLHCVSLYLEDNLWSGNIRKRWLILTIVHFLDYKKHYFTAASFKRITK